MSLLREEIGIQMPGNKKYVNEYINGVWSYVTALTSAIERYDGAPPWLMAKYEDYVNQQEQAIKGRLEKIRYDIDSPDTVHVMTGGEHIERVTAQFSSSYRSNP